MLGINPGGFTCTEGWSKLLTRYTEIQNENTRIREMDALRNEVEMLKEPELKRITRHRDARASVIRNFDKGWDNDARQET